MASRKRVSKTGQLHLASGGKQMVARAMYARGVAFLGAAMMLRRRGGHEWAVLQLLCQGTEVLLKAFLLLADYDRYQPSLKTQYRHDLEKLATHVLAEYGLHPLRPDVALELQNLNRFYERHLLRYASPADILVDPNSISSDLLLRRLAAALRIADARLADHGPSSRHSK